MSRKITVENSWVEGAPAYALDEKRGWLRVRVASVAGDKVNVKDGKRKFTVESEGFAAQLRESAQGTPVLSSPIIACLRIFV